MARQIRVEYPRAIYHVMSRGERREDIFPNDVDRHDFLKQRGWTESDLRRRRKSDREKLAMAARLRTETTLTIKRIAELLGLGTSKGANTNLHRWMRDHPRPLPEKVVPLRNKK